MVSKIVVLSGLMAVVLSVAAQQQQQVPIASQSSEINPDGSYQWSYQSGDGSSQQQSGQLKQVGQEVAEVVQGSAYWVDPQGGQHQINYVADENGYQPQGADLPVAPEIPAGILRALEYIAAHPQPAENQKNQINQFRG